MQILINNKLSIDKEVVDNIRTPVFLKSQTNVKELCDYTVIPIKLRVH